jgi:hypothetical protein
MNRRRQVFEVVSTLPSATSSVDGFGPESLPDPRAAPKARDTPSPTPPCTSSSIPIQPQSPATGPHILWLAGWLGGQVPYQTARRTMRGQDPLPRCYPTGLQEVTRPAPGCSSSPPRSLVPTADRIQPVPTTPYDLRFGVRIPTSMATTAAPMMDQMMGKFDPAHCRSAGFRGVRRPCRRKGPRASSSDPRSDPPER